MNAARTVAEALGLLKHVPPHRALASFRYDTGCWVWGFSYGYASQSHADARALTECQNQRGLQTDRACALVAADGAKPPGSETRSCFNAEDPIEP